MKRYTYTLFLFVFVFGNLLAQDEILPRGFAPGEEDLIPAYNEWRAEQLENRDGITDAPFSPIRTMAEWEELDALAISWRGFSSILTEIVRHAREECEVIILCRNQSDLNSAQNTLVNSGVDTSSNVTFHLSPLNSIWIRDYGPNPAYTNEVDSLVFIDWIYNRPRPQDDAVPDVIGNLMDIPVYSTTAVPTDLVHTGGNFMADGLGTGFSSRLVLHENDATNQWGVSNHSEDDINNIMNDFMGIEEYIKMTVLPYDAIHHIDMHMKLLDEETLLMGEYPQGIADGPQIEANLQYVLSTFMSPFGTPYEVVRMQMPPGPFGTYPNFNGDYRTYTNSIIINKTILVPIYEEQYDTTALRIWEETMPGYNIVGIDCNAIIPLSGALHCITKEIGSRDPLLIVHQRLRDVEEDLPEGYDVEATIKHRDGIANAKVYYTTDRSQGYQSVDMALENTDEDLWLATIPTQANGDTVFYYIHALANSGKEQVRPLPAPEGYWDFKIDWITDVDELEKTPTQLGEIYPNPASAITVIPVESGKRQFAKIELKDALGRNIETIFEGMMEQGAQQYFLFANKYASGTYLISIQTDEGMDVQKLMIK